MIPKIKRNFFAPAVLLVLALFVQGCFPAGMLPRNEDEGKYPALQQAGKVPARVGIYLSDSLKAAAYDHHKAGVSFQISIGGCMIPVAKEMASRMFADAVFVDSLPPYTDGYRPDVDAVFAPEVVYYRGRAEGILLGFVETQVKMQAAIYDLSGKVLWYDEAAGESRSERFNLISIALAGPRKIEGALHEALRSSADVIVGRFACEGLKGLQPFFTMKRLVAADAAGGVSDSVLFDKYYREGTAQFEKKNYYQALCFFEKAGQIRPEDLSAAFYAGACNTYIGRKAAALRKFERVVSLRPESREAADSGKWIKVLQEPLKIGVVMREKNDGRGGYRRIPGSDAISRAIGESRMYELVDMKSLEPPSAPLGGREMEGFLEKVFRKGVRAVVFITVEDMTDTVPGSPMNDEEYRAGDVRVVLVAKAFSTRKKKLHAEMVVEEGMRIMGQKSGDEEFALRDYLLERSARKLVLQMIEHDIF